MGVEPVLLPDSEGSEAAEEAWVWSPQAAEALVPQAEVVRERRSRVQLRCPTSPCP